MKKENAKSIIVKNKKRTRIICYVSLVVLTILLFLPMVLRIVIVEKIEVKNDVVTVMNCTTLDESISSTFLNDTPQNLLYKVKGDKTVIITNPDEENIPSVDSNENIDEVINNNLETQVATNNSETQVATNNSETQVATNNSETQIDTNDSGSQTESNNTVDNRVDNNLEPLFDILKPYSIISYSEEEKVTSVSASMSDLKEYGYYQQFFSTIDNQRSLYESYGFSCTTTTI